MPGERTAIWAVSALTGVLRKLREDAWGAAASPDGSQIAFANGLRSEIWLMGANGEQPRKLRRGEPGDRFFTLAWSPDGRRIASLNHRALSGQGIIESFDLEGGRSRVLASSLGFGGFCWAPDGRIIYSMAEPPPNQSDNLWELRTDARTGAATGQPRRLTNLAGFLLANLSLSADGERLAFLRARRQTDVWVGELAEKGARLNAPRRLTLDDRTDWLGGWTRDSQAVLFSSNRSGNFDIFRQGIQDRAAEAVVRSSEEGRWPAPSADGQWVLYLTRPYNQTQESPDSDRLMRAPVSGGPAEQVLKAGGFAGSAAMSWERAYTKRYPAFRCPSPPATSCVLAEADHKQIIFTAFDPIEGKKGELTRVEMNPFLQSYWDLSLDGKRVAVTAQESDAGRIRIVPLTGGPPREMSVPGWNYLSGVAWSADGQSLYVTRWTSRGSRLWHLPLNGEPRLLYQKTNIFERPLASPDGRHLAFTELDFDSNAWIVDNFR